MNKFKIGDLVEFKSNKKRHGILYSEGNIFEITDYSDHIPELYYVRSLKTGARGFTVTGNLIILKRQEQLSLF